MYPYDETNNMDLNPYASLNDREDILSPDIFTTPLGGVIKNNIHKTPSTIKLTGKLSNVKSNVPPV